jgi:hypothetical protein
MYHLISLPYRSDPAEDSRRHKMIEVTYSTYSSVLNRHFIDVKTVKTMADFRLFATALFHGNWSIISEVAV